MVPTSDLIYYASSSDPSEELVYELFRLKL